MAILYMLLYLVMCIPFPSLRATRGSHSEQEGLFKLSGHICMEKITCYGLEFIRALLATSPVAS